MPTTARVRRFLCLALLVLLPPRALALGTGQPAPEISAGEWLNSGPLTLQGLKGKVVVVEFWATWCPPCRASIPHLIEMNKRFKEKGVVFMGLTAEEPSVVKPFAKRMGMDYAVGIGSKSASAYGVRGIPHAFVVDAEGKIAWAGHPMAGLDQAIEKVLGGSGSDDAAPEVGKRAPEVKASAWANTEKGEPLSLEKLRGKVVVVEFWATWCPPCRESIPHLKDLYEKNKDKGVVVMGLSDEAAETVKPFMEKMKMTYPVGIGSDSGQAYGVEGIPQAFVVDPAGRIAWAGHPMEGLDEAVEKVLQNPPKPGDAGKPPAPDPEAQKKAEQAREADRTLNMARSALKNGDIEAAKKFFDEVCAKFPETPQALAAKRERPRG